MCERSGFYPSAVMEMPFFSSLSLSYHYIVIYIVDDKTKSDDDGSGVVVDGGWPDRLDQ